jgi:hypothetical protein
MGNMGRKDIEPQQGGMPASEPQGTNSVPDTLMDRRRAITGYILPATGMATGLGLLGGAVWKIADILGGSGENMPEQATADIQLPAEVLSPEQKAEILKERDKLLGILKDKEGMEIRSRGELPGVPGIRFTVLSHKDKIVEINTSGIAAGVGMLFHAAEAQLPSDYGQHLLRARDAIKQGKFVGTDAEIVLAYSGSPNTYPSPRDTAPDDFSAFAPIPEGASFADLRDREPTQGFMESGLVVMYGMNAGAIEGRVQRTVGGKRYTDLSPERALQAITVHELGHALLRLMGENRDPGEEGYMRDGIEAYVLGTKPNPTQPDVIKYL